MSWTAFKILILIAFLCVIFGGGIAFWGWQEHRLGQVAKPEPSAVDLATLKPGQALDNHHVTVGPHYALYFDAVYSYQAQKNAPAVPGPETSIDHCYYPIVAVDNPEAAELAARPEAAPGSNPPAHRLPKGVVFVVKTYRFKTVGQIPMADARRQERVEGVVINEIRPLRTDEKRLLQEGLPGINLKNVWVLEEGRKPSSSAMAIATMLGGGVLLLVGVLGGMLVIGLGIIGLARGRA